MRVKCDLPKTQQYTMSPARARTWTTRSGVERTNHEATAPPTIYEAEEKMLLGMNEVKTEVTKLDLFFFILLSNNHVTYISFSIIQNFGTVLFILPSFLEWGI